MGWPCFPTELTLLEPTPPHLTSWVLLHLDSLANSENCSHGTGHHWLHLTALHPNVPMRHPNFHRGCQQAFLQYHCHSIPCASIHLPSLQIRLECCIQLYQVVPPLELGHQSKYASQEPPAWLHNLASLCQVSSQKLQLLLIAALPLFLFLNLISLSSGNPSSKLAVTTSTPKR